MEIKKLKNILEAVLLGADRPLTVVHLESLFELDEERPTRDEIRKALHEMEDDYETRGYELKQVASGFRLQVRQDYAIWVGRLWEEKPARYTRALLETMSLIAYRQPITRGEIEEVRGVSVSSNIVKTLLEREWIKVLGHKDVPGKPTLYGTTKTFLDYFNLKTLDQLPTLAEIKDLDSIHPELELDDEAAVPENASENTNDDADQDENDAAITGSNDTGTNEDADDKADDVVVETVSEESTAEDLIVEDLIVEDVIVETNDSDMDSDVDSEIETADNNAVTEEAIDTETIEESALEEDMIEEAVHEETVLNEDAVDEQEDAEGNTEKQASNA